MVYILFLYIKRLFISYFGLMVHHCSIKPKLFAGGPQVIFARDLSLSHSNFILKINQF
jgi:hypothetical protein